MFTREGSMNAYMLSDINIKTYNDRKEYMYLGRPLTLTIGKYKAIYTAEGKLFFPDFLQFRFQTEVKHWFIKQAREIITEIVRENANRMNVSYISLSFSDTRSKWGSCTHDNRLQFCWRLVMAPIVVINYVVIHELVHTIEKNHSDNFWRKVRLYNPSCKQHIKWLKTYGDTLVI